MSFINFWKKLNPYRCSSFGYYVTSPNELTCKLCHSVIILTLDDMKDFSIPES